MIRRLVPAGLVALCVALALPGSAWGHAQVTSTTPAQGAALRHEPGQVVFRFGENVETQFGAVRVFNAKGDRVDVGSTTRPTGASAGVKLKPGLPDGAYTATYHVVSADSHPVSGGFTFTVGRSGGAPAASVASLVDKGGAGRATSIAFGVTRGVAYAATALLVGGALFLLVVWLPALRALAGGGASWPGASEAIGARVRRWGAVAAGVGAVASGAGIVLQGATASGTSFWSALDTTVIRDVVDTDFGTAWTVRLIAFLLLAAIAGLAPARVRVPALRPAVAAGALALLVTPAFSGHANSTSPHVLMLGVDVLHVAAMSAWVGGVVFLVALVPAATRRLEAADRTRLLATLVAGFSTVALVSVGVLVASGVLQSISHLGSFGELLSSGYGRAITIKSVVVLVLIGAGAANRQRTLPRLRRAAENHETPGRAGVALRRVIRAEVGLMTAAIAVTAALVGYAPPATSASGPLSVNRNLGPARLEMTVSPARAGNNEVHLYLFDRRSGAQYDKPRQVTVAASLPAKRIGPIDLEARKTGPGHYTVPSAAFVPGGKWTLEVTARVSDFDEYSTTVEAPIR